MKTKKKRPISAQDLYRLNIITDLELSPNGDYVVFSVQEVDQDSEKKYANLWITPTNGGQPYQFTFGKQVDSKPHWSPDGKTIAFLSNRQDEKQAQIYLLPFSGGEARPLTTLKGEFKSISWSLNGKTILYEFRKKDREATDRESDEKKKELGIVSRRINRVFFKLDAYGYLPQERWHLWTINTATGKAIQLTNSKVFDDLQSNWSPDGKEIVFVSNHSDSPDLNPDAGDLFILNINTKQVHKLETPFGPKGHPTFSPDGKLIAYFGHEGKGEDWKNTLVWVIPADSSKPARELSSTYDLHAAGWTINDIGTAQVVAPVWSADSKRVIFQAIQHGNTSLWSIDLNGKNLTPIINKTGVVGSYNFDEGFHRIGYFFATMKEPGQIWLLDLKNKHDKALTKLNHDWMKQIDLGSIEEFWFKGSDNNDLQGWVIKPPDFDPKKKYPSILEIHGGPMVQYGNFFMHEFYFLAAHGYMVYFTNPRGGRGYGEEHTKAIHNGKWGTVDYADLMHWTDFMQKQPYIDKSRMGVTGGSYGGYMTAWIIGHTQRFKAAVAQRVVSNLLSMWGSSDFNWSFQKIFGNKAPYEDIEQLWQCSPMKHLKGAKTPTLVIHSQNDLRCPIEQGEQLYIGLKNLGVETEFLVFPDSPHGVSRTGRTDRRIVRLNAILNWFEKYLR